jgi:hypothetical protein
MKRVFIICTHSCNTVRVIKYKIVTCSTHGAQGIHTKLQLETVSVISLVRDLFFNVKIKNNLLVDTQSMNV